MLYNIIIILLIIGVVFLMTKSDKLGKKYNKHSGKLIFFLLVLYMLVNKIYHGVAVLAVIFVLYYHKEIRKKLNIQKIDMKFLKNNVERFVNPESSESEEPKKEEGGDIFNEIDKLEEVATNSDEIEKEPFKDMVSDLRKSFDAIYNKLGEQK